MSREDWYVDGYLLTESVVRDVEYRAGLYGTPDVDGEDVAITGRTGRLWTPKTHGSGRFTLALWLGSDLGRTKVEALYDEMLRAMVAPHRQVLFSRKLSDGSLRQALGQTLAGVEPVPLGSLGMRIAFECDIPAGYWESTATYRESATMPVAGSTGTLTLPLVGTWRLSTAAMEMNTYTITGPAKDPVLTVVDGGSNRDTLRYKGTIGTGQTLMMNAATWAITGSAGFTPSAEAVTFTGRRFIVLPAARPGHTPTISMTASDVTVDTALSVSGRAAYLS